jgi:hypothetical protein
MSSILAVTAFRVGSTNRLSALAYAEAFQISGFGFCDGRVRTIAIHRFRHVAVRVVKFAWFVEARIWVLLMTC